MSAGEALNMGHLFCGWLNELQIRWSVTMLPVKPALAALAILVFLGGRTGFIHPLIVFLVFQRLTICSVVMAGLKR